VLPRVYPILDTFLLERLGLPALDAAQALAEGGASIVQLRHKGNFTRGIYEMAQQLASFFHAARIPFIINDRSDIAALLGAGVHLGQDDLPPAAARRVTGPETCIGYSTHNEAQLRAAASEPVDYLALGPIYSTSSKQNPDPVVGVDELRRLRHLTAKPLVAIGGIRLARALEVWRAGADSIALISDLFPEASKLAIRNRFEDWVSEGLLASTGKIE
jgi:thiamine-phosphate pyrophosphorylase